MKKKKVALVFGISNDYVFALANTIVGLKKYNRKFWDDIIVYHDSLSRHDMNNIKKLDNSIIFRSRFDEKLINNITPDIIKKYSKACMYRFDCFNLLKEYKCVIWNDVDILIQGNIEGLLEYGKKSGFAATLSSGGFNVEANFKKLIPEYNMFTPLYNSGILVLRDHLKGYEHYAEWCVNTAKKYAPVLRWPDQGIINLLIQEFNIDVEIIDIYKYCCHPTQKEHIKTASIIHAYGDEKFWNNDSLIKEFSEWKINNDEWHELCTNNININYDMPLVSCVMSVYNRYDFLRESVESILQQTYTNIELIIVLEKCENQLKIERILKSLNDNRIVIIKNSKKLGFAESLNVGFRISKGKYIARMDDDDISLKDRFYKQVLFMENNPQVGICGTNAIFFGKYSSVIGVETDSEKLKIITLFKTPFIHPTVMINKHLFDKYKLYYSSDYFTEDYELWSRAVQYFPFANIEDVLLKYRTGIEKLTDGSNELKLHNSHLRVMYNQFSKYLGLDLSYNELNLIQERKDVCAICFNRAESQLLLKKTLNKILQANRRKKVYNHRYLIDYKKHASPRGFKPFIKKCLKLIISPFYSSLMYRVDARIEECNEEIYKYIDKRLEEQDNQHDQI